MYAHRLQDPIVNKVVESFINRSNKGVEKYGTTLARSDIDLHGWLQHLQEELMDAVCYLERIKQDVSNQTQVREHSEVAKSDVQELRRSAECPSSLHAESDESVGKWEHSSTNSNSKVYGAFDPLY